MRTTNPLDRPRTRRSVLGATGVAIASSIAGCTNIVGSDSGDANAGGDNGGSSGTPQAATTPAGELPFMHTATGTTEYGVPLDGSPVMGADDAPVDIYYWSDYLCTYCSSFALQVHPQLLEEDVQAGRVRMVFLELPFKGENSVPAAVLAKCVWEQFAKDDPNAYWEWHQAIYQNQGDVDSGWADREKLLAITSDLGIDTGPIKDCINSSESEKREEIQTEIDLADRAALKGTPAFVLVNKAAYDGSDTVGDDGNVVKKVEGSHPYELFSKEIQSVLNAE